MEQYAHNSQYRTWCIYVIILFFKLSNIVGQTIIPPQFINTIDEGEVKNYMELAKIMGSIERDSIHTLPTCYAGMGTFSFYVTSNGVVDIVNFFGNLPQGIITKIKLNILTTSGKWIPQFDNGKSVDSMPFIFIYYLNVLSCGSMPNYQRNEHQMSFLLEKAINSSENKKFTVLNNAYLLPVGGIDVMR